MFTPVCHWLVRAVQVWFSTWVQSGVAAGGIESSCQEDHGRNTFFSQVSWSSLEMQNIPGKCNSLFGISHETQDPGQNFPFSTRLLYGIRNLWRLHYMFLVLFILATSQQPALSGDCSKQCTVSWPQVSTFLKSIYLAIFSISLYFYFPFPFFVFLLILLPSTCLPFLCPYVSSFMFLQSDTSFTSMA